MSKLEMQMQWQIGLTNNRRCNRRTVRSTQTCTNIKAICTSQAGMPIPSASIKTMSPMMKCLVRTLRKVGGALRRLVMPIHLLFKEVMSALCMKQKELVVWVWKASRGPNLALEQRLRKQGKMLVLIERIRRIAEKYFCKMQIEITARNMEAMNFKVMENPMHKSLYVRQELTRWWQTDL